jgi:hypothetical protein
MIMEIVVVGLVPRNHYELPEYYRRWNMGSRKSSSLAHVSLGHRGAASSTVHEHTG